VTDLAPFRDDAIISPFTGELVPYEPEALADFIAVTMRHVRAAYAAMDVAKRALAEEAARQGSGTLHFPSADVTVTPPAWSWDVEGLEEDLRAAGCPEDVLNEVIKTTVERKVDAKRADRLARANDAYRAAVEANRERPEKSPTVTVKAAT
jgi:hypothetical protein